MEKLKERAAGSTSTKVVNAPSSTSLLWSIVLSKPPPSMQTFRHTPSRIVQRGPVTIDRIPPMQTFRQTEAPMHEGGGE